DAGRLAFGLAPCDGQISRYRSTGSTSSERLVRRAGVFHADAERGALLGLAKHVCGIDVDLGLPQSVGDACERPGLVRETDLEDLPVARDAVLGRLDRPPGLRRVGVVDDDANRTLARAGRRRNAAHVHASLAKGIGERAELTRAIGQRNREDRKSTRLNSSHLVISYAVF